MKKENGITLIALVVTIVVLLILAGVSISMLAGENGIVTRGITAKENTEIGKEKEEIAVAYNGAKIEKEGENDITADDIQKQFDKNNTNAIASGKIDIYFPESKRWYKINGGGNITGPSDTEPEGGVEGIYDGINNPEDENYNENGMHIGDYVKYTAGVWEETKKEIEYFEFGGYEAGQSRDTNAFRENTNSEIYYDGWRIFDISEDKKTVTLISAGCPEVYSHKYIDNYMGFRSGYILTGKKSEDDIYNSTEGATPRNWDMYVNHEKYGIEAKALEKEELDKWYNKYIDNDITDIWEAEFPVNSSNKLISILSNNMSYFLATPCLASSLYGSLAKTLWTIESDYDDDYYTFVSTMYNNKLAGIRILVKLDTNVVFEETTEKIEKDGFTYNVWEIN